MSETELDKVLEKHTKPGFRTVHGATFVAINSKGETIYQKSFGSRTIDGTDPLTPDSLTWIASATKLVASIAGMQVIEKGLIGLDDDVRPFLPGLANAKVLLGWDGPDDESAAQPIGRPIFEEVQSKITPRQLLSHTCGLSYDNDGINPLIMKWSAWCDRTDDMYSGTLQGITHPLVCQPGRKWVYGVGLDWICQLVEALTGQDFETYMQEHILKPVGAKSTTFHPDRHFGHAKWQTLMQEMAEIRSDGGYVKAVPPWHGDPQIALGGIGLYTTPNDYGKLLGALISGGAPLLKEESVEELLGPQNIGDEAVEALQDFIFGKPYGLDRHLRTTDDKTSSAPLVLQSLAGTVTTENVKGRRKRGTVNWGGNPNIVWWIDREGGVAAAVFTQLRPNFEMKYTLSLDLEDALYAWLDKQGGR